MFEVYKTDNGLNEVSHIEMSEFIRKKPKLVVDYFEKLMKNK